MASQPKLPHTQPTPAQARAQLRIALDAWNEKRLLVSRLKDDAKTAAAAVDEADREAGVAERDLLAAKEGSAEDADAAARLARWLATLEKSEDAAAKVKDTLRRAVLELDAAEKVRRGARGDIRAVQEGRRK